jgi:hypothetical protein
VPAGVFVPINSCSAKRRHGLLGAPHRIVLNAESIIASGALTMWSRCLSLVPLLTLVAMSLSLPLLGGCKSKAQKAADEQKAIEESNVATIRARYQRINPNNRVGLVVAVSSSSNHVAVGDIPLQDFGIGDVMVFLDRRERPFNSGEVVNATSDALHVRYDAKRRAPRVGELAVRLAQ